MPHPRLKGKVPWWRLAAADFLFLVAFALTGFNRREMIALLEEELKIPGVEP